MDAKSQCVSGKGTEDVVRTEDTRAHTHTERPIVGPKLIFSKLQRGREALKMDNPSLLLLLLLLSPLSSQQSTAHILKLTFLPHLRSSHPLYETHFFECFFPPVNQRQQKLL